MINVQTSYTIRTGQCPSSHLRAISQTIIVFICMFVATSAAFGQVTTADIVGTVTDSSGAVLPKAKITIKNLGTSNARTAETNESGGYLFNLLPIGTYSLEVDMQGFKSFNIPSLTLSVGDRARFDATMQPGAAGETVSVTADRVPALHTDSSNVGSTVDRQAVQDLPLNGRNYINLVQIAPGVNAGPPNAISSGGRPDDRRASSAFSANGQSDLFNNNLIDGLDNNEREQGFIGVRPSIDGIDQIAVDTNTYRAESGRSAGAVVNIITKAGTNQFHGSAYEFFRNDIFDARNFFATSGPKPEYRQNQFGGSIGGPIIKDKTFFFADVEESRIVRGTTYTSSVPTLYEEAHPGDFSDRPGGPNLIAMGVPINQTALNYFRLYPAPNAPGAATSQGTIINNYNSSPSIVQNSTTVDGRLDHHFSPRDSFFVRYAWNPVTTIIPGMFPSVNGIQPASGSTSNTTAQNIQADYLHIFSPNLLLDLKMGYTRINIATTPLNLGTNASTTLGVVGANIPTDAATSGLAPMALQDGAFTNLGDDAYIPIYDVNNIFQWAGSVSYTRGAHNIKIGGALIRRQLNYYQSPFPAGQFSFNTFNPNSPSQNSPYNLSAANFLAGHVYQVQRQSLTIHPGYRTWEPSAYIQDDWRATSKLTLNLGVRYEMFTPITESQNRYANFDINSLQLILASQGHPTIGVSTDYKDVSPRVGFAASLTPRTVVRGGYGISFYPTDIQGVIQNNNPPYSFFYSAFNTDLASGEPLPSVVDPSSIASNPNVTSLTVKSRNFRPGYIQQFNLMLQQQIGGNVVTIGYVGELGRRLLYQTDLDRPAPVGPSPASTPAPAYVYARQLPFVNSISYNYNGASSNYNALQVSLERRFNKGLTFNANYTLAHGLNNTINGSGANGAGSIYSIGLLPNKPSYDYGNSDIDIRHRISVSVNYQLPGSHLTGMRAVALKGWQVNGIGYWQTGVPFTVASTNAQINLPGITVDRPNYNGHGALSNPSINRWYDTTAFSPQVFGTAGNSGRNQLYGPHDRRVDLSLFKDFELHKDWKLQFRAESFDISNTPNFAVPNVNYNTPSGGTINSTAANENPRQFQFALKLSF